jgi:hypothetical protein
VSIDQHPQVPPYDSSFLTIRNDALELQQPTLTLACLQPDEYEFCGYSTQLLSTVPFETVSF